MDLISFVTGLPTLYSAAQMRLSDFYSEFYWFIVGFLSSLIDEQLVLRCIFLALLWPSPLDQKLFNYHRVL